MHVDLPYLGLKHNHRAPTDSTQETFSDSHAAAFRAGQALRVMFQDLPLEDFGSEKSFVFFPLFPEID